MRDAIRWDVIGTLLPLMGFLLLLPVDAQQPTAAGVPAAGAARPQAAPDREQWENALRVMKGELERSEARVSAIRAQMISLDADIESRVNRIISLITTVRDSTDGAGTRIRRAKEEAIEGLKASAIYYAQQRDRRKKEMDNPYAQLDDATLARDVEVLNEKIEVRITQSLAIASSLVQHWEGPVEKYRGSGNDTSAKTIEYRRLDRDAKESVKIKTELVEDLRKSIDKLTREKKARESELGMVRDPQKQEQLTQEIESLRQTIEARRDQVEELLATSAPPTRPVSTKAAFELDKMLDEMSADLKSDFSKFKSLVSEFDTARVRVNQLRTRIEKATLALESMHQTEAPESKTDRPE